MSTLITSERKYNECPKCHGKKKIIESSGFPWMPDSTSTCMDCHGTGKVETKKYDFDSNVFNIATITTIGKIDSELDYYSGITEGATAKVWFYINGHIKIEKCGNYRSGNENLQESTEKDDTLQDALIKAGKDRQNLYIEIKKIRDELIRKMKK